MARHCRAFPIVRLPRPALILSLLVAAMPSVAIGPNPAAARGGLVRQSVVYGDVPPGTIVVKQSERRLYLTLQGGMAIRYPVAVGMAGKRWSGESIVDGKYLNPAWSPPHEVKRDKPWLPDVISGGSPRNPMGVRALTLAGGDYAIHGTNMPNSIGKFASYGCIRMYNKDIVDLFDRVPVGTRVVVLP